MKKNAIIIFVKYPAVGKVKTRLASSTNNNFAVKIYKIIAKHIFFSVDKLKQFSDVYIFYPQNENKQKIKSWIDKKFNYSIQKGSDLGEKINNAFISIFSKGYKNAVIIGSDIPDISPITIIEAFYLLKLNDIVIAPSSDGGYSLLGIKNIQSQLFENINWSTESVLRQTIANADKCKLKYKTMDTIDDIDTIDDLYKWINNTCNKELKEQIITNMRKENVKNK